MERMGLSLLPHDLQLVDHIHYTLDTPNTITTTIHLHPIHYSLPALFAALDAL
jgi:hypothetical protein